MSDETWLRANEALIDAGATDVPSSFGDHLPNQECFLIRFLCRELDAANARIDTLEKRHLPRKVFEVGDFVAYDVNSYGTLVSVRGDRSTVRHENGGEVMLDTAELRFARKNG